MRILIIEDDLILQKMYLDKFINEGFEVFIADNGKTGIIQAVKERPDFILLDVLMPVMDGITALKYLKDIPETKNIPVAMLTAVPKEVPERLTDPEMDQKITGYLQKDSMKPSEIVEYVTNYLMNNAPS